MAEPKFKCPRCGSKKTTADDPHSWVDITYNDEGQIEDSSCHSGLVFMNEQCLDCDFQVDKTWGEKK